MAEDSMPETAQSRLPSQEELEQLLLEVTEKLPTNRADWLALEREILSKALTPLGVDTTLLPESVLMFRATLSDESDRGCALTVAAYLDSELEALLRRYLVDDEKAADSLLSGNGGLATFSSRIELAYLLGLVGPAVRRDLHLIRRIRNEFAHLVERTSFDDGSISDRCRELRHVVSDADLPPRKQFTSAAMGMAAAIHTADRRFTRCVARNDVDLTSPELRSRADAMDRALDETFKGHFGAP